MTNSVELTGLLYDPSRHGKPRWYVRIRGRRMRIPEVKTPPPYPSTQEAIAAYWTARGQLEATQKTLPQSDSLKWLIEMYFRSKTFARLDDLTQRERRSVLGRIAKTHGTKPYGMMQSRHVVKLRDELDGNPANKRVKILRYLFSWAIEEGHAKANPAKDVKLLRVASEGYRAWTPDEVAQFEQRHPLGTKAHLAMALLLFTGVRRSDVVKLGPVNRRKDRFIFVQHKGRNVKPKRRNIPIVSPLQSALDAAPLGETTYLETEYGKPFSIAGFGNWFRARCDEAGLTGLSAHGLRKAVGSMAAERGCTAHQIMEILGHDTLEEAERYTRQANARRIGDEGFARLHGTEQEKNVSHLSVAPKNRD